MLFKGVLISQASGRLGDSVWAHNRGGPYVRALGNPNPNPATDLQLAMRTAYSEIVDEWHTLTNAQREKWRNYSHDTLRTGRIGTRRPAGGWPEFLRTNQLRQLADDLFGNGWGTVSTPPNAAWAPLPDPLPTVTTSGSANFHVHFPSGFYPRPSGQAGMIAYASPILQPSTRFFKTGYAFVGAMMGSYGTDDWTFASPGDWHAPNYRRLKFRIMLADGRLSRPWTYDLTGSP